MAMIIKEYKAKVTRDGDNVKLNRVFGYDEVKDFDPFLLLDYFETKINQPVGGFPWHPHKGIETVTYMLRGKVKHEDSLGHKGIVGPTDLQWMTAGNGILHQEMPETSIDGYQGFQFWINMPKVNKLDPPNYQEFKGDELKHIVKDGVKIVVISGEHENEPGPVDKHRLGVVIMDVEIPKGKSITLFRHEEKNGYIFIFEGKGTINKAEEINHLRAYTLESGLIKFENNGEDKLRFIFAEGNRLNEPIAWRGPIVMNTNEEIKEAVHDLEKGTFVQK